MVNLSFKITEIVSRPAKTKIKTQFKDKDKD